MTEDEKLTALEKSVARYLFIESKDVPDSEARIFRAAALLLLGEPIDSALLRAVESWPLDDGPLYSRSIQEAEDLSDLWLARLV